MGVKSTSIKEAAQLIEWANISMDFKKEIKDRALAPGHTYEEAIAFLSAMAEDYDECEQQVSGTIMLKDGTWLDRIIYWGDEDWDNSYWKWVHRSTATHSAPQFKPLS